MQASADTVHREAIVIDGCSFFSRGWHERLAIAGVTALQMTVAWPNDDSGQAMRRYGEYWRLAAQDDRLAIITTADDIRTCHRQGKVGFILGSQNARMLDDSLLLVEAFWHLGVRVIQLTYNERNLLGDGCLETTNAGLSRFGHRVVAEMNRLGMVIDLTHCAERTSLDALEASTAPCLFSHSNPKALAENPRNITDEQIRLCAEQGGVIGLSSWAPICWRGGPEPPSLDDFIAHAEYVAELVGPDHVAVGTDSEATPGAYPPQLISSLAADYPEARERFVARFPSSPKTAGLATMEDLPGLTAALLDRGWKPEDVNKLLGENLLRVYERVWGGSS